ncbi:hypothetical protein PR048_032290 [Dryococelus australis]|uniref:HTH psq-type domain-containing protein n=1 Tax=Dryococelus australis TaxID=614101 RepID=A0ABQ9G308_9NEOP|nr:hypothetical protein PR048_032290 [Dryococelus australis]
MEAAMHAARKGRMSYNMSATIYKIPEATLRRYLNTDPENLPVHRGRFRKVFTPEQLDELRSYLT